MAKTLDIQEECWNNEYLVTRGIPTSPPQSASGSVCELLEHLKSQGRTSGTFLDIGCGRGGNARFFSENGFKACGFDLSSVVLNDAHKEHAYVPELFLVHCDARGRWPFKDHSFDAALDGTTMINMTTDELVQNYITETRRVLNQTGVLMITAPVLPDEFYSQLVQAQGNRIVVHGAGIRQRVYTAEELKKCYELHFRIVREDCAIKRKNEMYGKIYHRTLCRLLLEVNSK